MFERFTEPARQVIVQAQEEARTLKHSYIGTEHVLLGLLREQEGLAARVLESLEVTADRVRALVVRIVGSGEEVTSGQIPFTPRAKKVLELSLREALSLGHNHIGTEHILLALVRENEGVAARILLDFDAGPEKIRNEVIRVLSGPSGRRAVQHARVAYARSQAHSFPEAESGLNVPIFPSPEAGPGLAWFGANLMWRPEGLELRVPLRLQDAAMATLATDAAWTQPPLAGLRREIWRGWLALSSPTLLDDVDPAELRTALDAAVQRALAPDAEPGKRAEHFLAQLRSEPS
jgi:hypothetical protein